MPESDLPLDLLYALRDSGVSEPAVDALRARVQIAVQREIDSEIDRPRRRRGRAPRLKRRPTVGGVVAAIVSIAVVVAVSAVALLARPGGGEPSGAATPQALISKLAVLRRPQTAADVLPVHLHLANPSGALIRSLSRLVATLPGARLFLVVVKPGDGSSPIWSPKFGDQVAIVSVSAHGSTESEAFPAADLMNADQLTRTFVTNQRAGEYRDAYNVGIVPDGIARVRWTFAGESGNPGRVVYPHVANNVAIVRVQRSTAMLLRATWYAADGSIIPSSEQALRRAIAARQAGDRARALRHDARYSYRAAPALLADFAVLAINSRSGVRTAAGNTISHPPLSALPLSILEITSPDQPPQLDPEEIRQITTPSGIQLWVIPGRRGMCLAVIDQLHLAGAPGAAGAGEGCSANLAQAETAGVGLSSGRPGGVTMIYGVVPKTRSTVTVRTGLNARRTIRPADGVYVVQTGPRHR